MRIFLLFITLQLYGGTDLEHFLEEEGYFLTPAGTAIYEGYITPKQKDAFIRELKRHPEIRKIAEVGFNAGHTSEIFLDFAPQAQLVSFDINMHEYTNIGVAFMEMKYRDRFRFVEGNSRYTIPKYFKVYPEEKFDLIYIDGCHLFGACLDDIFHFKSLAHKNSILWIDDFNFPEVERAVKFAAKLSIIEIVKTEFVEDEMGIRSWAEARYIVTKDD